MSSTADDGRRSRKFVLASEVLKEQGMDCGDLFGIGIAFVHDSTLGKFVISESVSGGAAHGTLLSAPLSGSEERHFGITLPRLAA